MSTKLSPIRPQSLERIPPGLRFALTRLVEAIRSRAEPDSSLTTALFSLYDRAEPWVGLEPALAQFGYELVASDLPSGFRRAGCAWLTLFPTAETMTHLAAVALDPDIDPVVREQATYSLGFRQSRFQPIDVQWTAEAIATADAALIRLAKEATAARKIPFVDLPIALRHLDSPALHSVFAEAPLLWGAAFEAFANPELARVLLDRVEEIPNDHQLRVLRLAASTLGPSAVDRLVALADRPVADPLEPLFLAMTFAGDVALAKFEERISSWQHADQLRKRARWHLANPGVVPTTRALATARTTGILPGDQRAEACARAADDFAALTPFARHPESYLYKLWAAMVNGCADPQRARALTNAHPESRSAVKGLYLEDLARRGRAKQVIAAAQQLKAVEEGARALAVHGRPFLALELAATSRLNNADLAVARVLGLYRAGRPDLARRVLAEELPPAEVVDLDVMPDFPGADERWVLEHRPDFDPALRALVGGETEVLGLAMAAPENSEPDSFSFETIAALERWLARPIEGATVFLAGEFPGDSKERHSQAILERGGRLVDGPFPGTHYYVMGLTCLVTIIAQLERQGTRRIRNEELGLSW